MHQVAHRYTNGFSNGLPAEGVIRVVLLLANSLDCESLTESLSRQPNIEVLAATADIDFGLVRCERLCPQVMILDPKVASDSVQRAAEMVRLREIEHLLVLDDRLHEGRLTAILSLPAVSYLTRQAGFGPLLSGIQQIAKTGRRAFDPAVRQRIRRDTRGLILERSPNRPSVASLTSRELQVMKLLADGYSVRRCAERLDLAESTIDNHKSRLMKKLDLHKVVELTHMAIREGLIVV